MSLFRLGDKKKKKPGMVCIWAFFPKALCHGVKFPFTCVIIWLTPFSPLDSGLHQNLCFPWVRGTI